MIVINMENQDYVLITTILNVDIQQITEQKIIEKKINIKVFF